MHAWRIPTGGDQRGRAYGVYAMAADLGATIGPLRPDAWLYAQVGASMPFYVNGLILAACCSAVLALLLQVPARVARHSGLSSRAGRRLPRAARSTGGP